ncbi:hypothetical protein Gotri_017948, partial [Gossypium trilobum]|nr:hypothetical protein [Gossypium trilobum]MBA0769188.1 hypothetical protein [Gossypium trilobum]
METELAQLSINEDEEEILQIQDDLHPNTDVGDYQLIRDLGEKRYLFKFFHSMDMERVLKGLPWTFNNHLLILSNLNRGEDPLKIPLIFVPFW